MKSLKILHKSEKQYINCVVAKAKIFYWSIVHSSPYTATLNVTHFCGIYLQQTAIKYKIKTNKQKPK